MIGSDPVYSGTLGDLFCVALIFGCCFTWELDDDL